MMANIWWSLPTLIVFFAARKLAARYKFPLLNPLLVAMGGVIIPFYCLDGAVERVLNDLLQQAYRTGYPLSKRARWKSIITICFIGSVVCDGDRDFCGIVDGRFTGNRRVNPAEIESPRLLQWRLAAVLYSGNQRSLRDFRRHPRRCVWPYIA